MRSLLVSLIIGCALGALIFFAPMGQQQPRDKGSSYNSQRKIVRDPAGRIYVAYTKPVNNSSQVFVQISEDQGAKWRDLAQVSPPTGDATTPMIAIDSRQNLHVFWTQYVQNVRQIFYAPIEQGRARSAQELTAGPPYKGYPSLLSLKHI
ncbi:MAG: glycoside hydrolase [Candidatus Bipolaricaulota bacterium]|nr:glycoside hydrolase [Candidatus Bipolaricaulota bacterium]